MSDMGGTSEPGWKPDPDGRHDYRWWDGTAWSDQVSDGGIVSTDQPGPAPVVPPTTVDQPPVYPAAGPPVYGAAPPAPGAYVAETPPGTKSGVPVGVLALIGLVVVALVVGVVLLLTGGDDGGSTDEAVATSDDGTDEVSDEVTDEVTDDITSDLTNDFSDELSDDFSDDFTDPFSDDLTEDTGGDISANNLEVGDCVESEDVLNSSDVSAVDCGSPHVFELYARFDVASQEYDDATLQIEGQRCTDALFEDYIGVAYVDSEIYASPILPSAETWALGDRTVLCFAHTQDLAQTTGSVEGANR